MEITDIKVRKLFDDGPMKAIVSVTFDNELALHDVKVINARDRYFIRTFSYHFWRQAAL